MALLSLKDPLTGAWNRRYLDEKFPAIRAESVRNQQQLHFALIDIDDFKRLNDGLGHDFGDLVLCRLVAVYEERLPVNDHLVRMGGDEFLLILSGADPVAVAEEGAAALSIDPQLSVRSGGLQVNVSVGLVSIQPDSELSLDMIYRRADQALYQAKQAKGRGDRAGLVVEAVGG